jgi:subtilisin family serine protease
MRLLAATVTSVSFALLASSGAAGAPSRPLLAVGYGSPAALRAAVTGGARLVRLYPRIHVAEVLPAAPGFTGDAGRVPGIRYVERVHSRVSATEPALFSSSSFGAPYEWQYAAAHADGVPASVLRAAASVTIAVIDTGADLTAPDLAAKAPRTHNVRTGGVDVRDVIGHGTFVASLAAGSVTNGEGVAGFGGDAKLLVIKASSADGSFTDLDEANALVYAVDHGARVINLSIGGPETSETEKRGIAYATQHGALVVAAIGNEYERGNPVEYPAALLQPVGSNGRGGVGLSVGASTTAGTRAAFSNTGSQLSLVAPGEHVLGALSSTSGPGEYTAVTLPGSASGLYGFGTGTSFATPEVAGAAALVFAANPLLTATDAAEILKESASNDGTWNPATGFGVLDVAAAVARAQNRPVVALEATRAGKVIRLHWSSASAGSYRLTVRAGGKPPVVLLDRTTRTSAEYRLTRGPRYVFTVAAFDAAGTRLASATSSLR